MLIQVFDVDLTLRGCWEQRMHLTNEQAIALAEKDLIPVEVIGSQMIEYEFEYDFVADTITGVKRHQKSVSTSLDDVIDACSSDEDDLFENIA